MLFGRIILMVMLLLRIGGTVRHGYLRRLYSSISEGQTQATTVSQHTHLMRLALRHAQHAFREKEVPIGAVIVDDKGRVIATGRNQVETKQDPTCHAEINCLRAAAAVQGTWRLIGHTLYTTLEPCPMCMGAIQQARIRHVVYAANDTRLGACGSWIDMVNSNKHPFHEVDLLGGVLESEASALMKRFFLLRRREGLSRQLETDMVDRGYDFRSTIEIE
jgi:tRNA(adenine34) deaminase